MNTKKLKKNKTNKRLKKSQKNKIQRNYKMKQKAGQGGIINSSDLDSVRQPINFHELSDQHKLGIEEEDPMIKQRQERQKIRQLELLKENLKLCEQKRKDDLQKIKLWLQSKFSDLGFIN